MRVLNRDRVMKMDPYMLLSIINMKLRDQFSSLDDLCEDFEVTVEELKNKLNNVGYKYQSETNQFVAN
ncbi:MULTISPECIES: DUF4250 domain-containing protein [Clostridium]|uniref:DUF4250 domain-containing protein n=1 Tax=Clostridium novyi (strain NT) TaxID=386415 RepID=A0PYI1_CLONN|nr:conserved hypothetical protein [Clostridium novyi NT]